MKKRNTLFLLSFLMVVYLNTFGQNEDNKIIELSNKIDELSSKINSFTEKNKSDIFKFGLSISTRTFLNSKDEKKARSIILISPNQKVVNVDYFDRLAVVISTSVSVFPFDSGSDFKNFGFTANINLAEFADNQSNTVFNKQIDGGLGFAYFFDTNKKFALGITYERIAVRRPTDFVLAHIGKVIMDENGEPYSTLDLKDDRFYINSGVNGLSVKFIFHFDN